MTMKLIFLVIVSFKGIFCEHFKCQYFKDHTKNRLNCFQLFLGDLSSFLSTIQAVKILFDANHSNSLDEDTLNEK